MFSTWDKSLETGNAEIDNQHRQLTKLTDELSAANHESHSDVLRILDKVMEFTLVHFLSEEELMAQVNYPPDLTKEMLEQHRGFKSYARMRVLEFRRGEELNVLPLHSSFDHFLKTHEFGMDRLLADWIRKQS